MRTGALSPPWPRPWGLAGVPTRRMGSARQHRVATIPVLLHEETFPTVATKIRLKRLGKIRTPHYRVVVMDARAKRDGRPIEEIGQYHPKSDPSVIVIDSERAQYWLGVGAQPTEAVVALLKRTGDWQKFSGDDSPSGIVEQAVRPDKEALFNAALAEGDNAPAGEAISRARRGRKAIEAAEAITEALEGAGDKADEASESEAESSVEV